MGGDKDKYVHLILPLLSQQVYPMVAQRLAFPMNDPFTTVRNAMMELGQDFELSWLWFETELMMRNDKMIWSAFHLLKEQHFKPQGQAFPLELPRDFPAYRPA